MGPDRSPLRFISRLAAIAVAVASSDLNASDASAAGNDDGSPSSSSGVNLRGSVVSPVPPPALHVLPAVEGPPPTLLGRDPQPATMDSSNADEPMVPLQCIIGGTEVQTSDRYKFLASLTRGNVHWCGAAVIASDYLVTAGHCDAIDGARLGSVDKSDTSATHGNVVMFAVEGKQKKHHDFYSLKGYLHDIMLIALDEPLDSSAFPPIAINTDPDIPSSGQTLTTMGWGNMDDGSKPDILQEVDVDCVNQRSCLEAFHHKYIKDDMVCAIAPGRDACRGDSGGPLIVPGSYGPGGSSGTTPPTLVGTVSWGFGCDSGHPGVYSRLSDAADWIRAELCDNSVAPPSWTGCASPSRSSPLDGKKPKKSVVAQQLTTAGRQPRQQQILLEFQFDRHPVDIGWEVKCGPNGNKTTLGSRDVGYYADSRYGFSRVEELVAVPAGTPGTCLVTITDEFTDGLCIPQCSGHYVKVKHVVGNNETTIGELGDEYGLIQDASEAWFDQKIFTLRLLIN